MSGDAVPCDSSVCDSKPHSYRTWLTTLVVLAVCRWTAGNYIRGILWCFMSTCGYAIYRVVVGFVGVGPRRVLERLTRNGTEAWRRIMHWCIYARHALRAVNFSNRGPRPGIDSRCFEAIVRPAEQGFASTEVLVPGCSVTQLASSVLPTWHASFCRPRGQTLKSLFVRPLKVRCVFSLSENYTLERSQGRLSWRGQSYASF